MKNIAAFIGYGAALLENSGKALQNAANKVPYTSLPKQDIYGGDVAAMASRWFSRAQNQMMNAYSAALTETGSKMFESAQILYGMEKWMMDYMNQGVGIAAGGLLKATGLAASALHLPKGLQQSLVKTQETVQAFFLRSLQMQAQAG